MRETQTISEATVELNRRLKEWRRNHGAPTPIPADIWAGAIKVAERHGINPTARALGLNYASLKVRMSPTRELRKTSLPASTTFVELLTPLSPTIPECAVEVESTRGTKLRVEIRNVSPSGLATIMREFVG